jgi:hypothetical protein
LFETNMVGTPVLTVLRVLRQDNQQFESGLGCIVKHCLQNHIVNKFYKVEISDQKIF